MKQLKRISGDVLLFLYTLQRGNGIPPYELIRFSHFGDRNIQAFECNAEIKSNLLKIADNSLQDLYNSTVYLKEKKFIDCKWSEDSGGVNIFLLRVSALGIDIIEGVERGEKEKDQFTINFNIKLADNVNLDSLIKTELGGLIQLKP